MKHTVECHKALLENKKKIQEYAAKWPNYCRKCNAQGGHIIYGTRYHKDGSGTPDEFNPCPECQEIEFPKCPRCGKEWGNTVMEDNIPCPHCGWNWGYETSEDFAPEPYECWNCDDDEFS